MEEAGARWKLHRGLLICCTSFPQRAGSRPTLGSVAVQAPEGSLAAVDQRQMDTLSATQAKAKCKKKFHHYSPNKMKFFL